MDAEAQKSGSTMPEVSDSTLYWAYKTIAGAGAYSASVAYAAMMIVALPFSINYIINGHAMIPSADSQFSYSMCFWLKQVGSVLFAAMLGELGNSVGRKKIVVGAVFAYFLTAVMSFAGTWTEIWVIHAIAQFFLGIFSPFYPSGMVYLIDVSPIERLRRNVGGFSAANFGGLLTGFIMIGVTLRAFGDIKIPESVRNACLAQYSFAALVCLIALLVLLARLPDISPAMDKRHPYRMTKGIPCHMLKDMWKWTPYMRFTYLQIMLGPGAAASAAQAYGVNYAMKRYGLSTTEVSDIVIADLLVSTICAGISLRCVKFKVLIPFTYGIMILCPILSLVTPSKKIFIWIISLVSALAAAQQHALNTLFYVQVTEAHRGSLAGALKTGDSLGRSIGALVGGLWSFIWFQSPELRKSFAGFPDLVPFGFMSAALLVHVYNEKVHGKENRLDIVCASEGAAKEVVVYGLHAASEIKAKEAESRGEGESEGVRAKDVAVAVDNKETSAAGA
eukprot:gnl/TRDRNA2_/TRDRNA2_173835_c0_seq2.p1 gnl/TRDRNA2_/TRDRNA2_173835_c0~~gnl/TRDRNA2_/TRDRNA2_173835_c0_seq2.p1  ORF type:complete len:505 (+),score=62.25 gnl/TRDRNA2_/TRDRNA2_173835_c0_seq2:85-1599(+)